MAFFHVTLNVREAGRSLKLIVEVPGADVDQLFSFLDGDDKWLFGLEWRTVRDGERRRWINHETAINLANVARVNLIQSPVEREQEIDQPETAGTEAGPEISIQASGAQSLASGDFASLVTLTTPRAGSGQ
jgi:hypothetical protein